MPRPQHFKNKKTELNYSTTDLLGTLAIFTPNRIKVIAILPEYRDEAMRFKFLKNYTELDAKNLQITLKALLKAKLITFATDAYKSGYKKNGEENWVTTHPHYYLTSFGILVREMLSQMADLQKAFNDKELMSIKTETTGYQSIPEYFTREYFRTLLQVPITMSKLMQKLLQED